MNRTTLNRAYGKFFGIEQWDYFSTLTYKYPKSIKRNRIEMDRLTKYFKKYPDTTRGSLRAELVRDLYSIYNRVMHQNKKPSNCPSCVRNVLSSLKNIYLTYEDK